MVRCRTGPGPANLHGRFLGEPSRKCAAMFDRSKILNEGAEAGLDGSPIESCPYPITSLQHDLWLEGWRCADDGTFAVHAVSIPPPVDKGLDEAA
ncbi:ribosome modulation factor [Enterovirga sp. CN4-39]|uniref:ribosome modulation factor n=1 Tax=Enterovirga sp. CN4-39 TaxID=3400910 RepID=UPI003BFCF534